MYGCVLNKRNILKEKNEKKFEDCFWRYRLPDVVTPCRRPSISWRKRPKDIFSIDGPDRHGFCGARKGPKYDVISMIGYVSFKFNNYVNLF